MQMPVLRQYNLELDSCQTSPQSAQASFGSFFLEEMTESGQRGQEWQFSNSRTQSQTNTVIVLVFSEEEALSAES